MPIVSSIRTVKRQDLQRIKEISDSSFPGERDIPWFEKYLSCKFICHETDGRIDGFAILEGRLIALIAVEPSSRKKGIATKLVKALLEGTEGIFLRVRESNADAIRFFGKLGFRKNKMKKAYYSNGENAIEMMHG